MNTRLITNYEIAQKQQDIHHDFRRSQATFTIPGVRRLVGNTFIALGERIYGRLEDCRQTAQLPRKAAPVGGI